MENKYRQKGVLIFRQKFYSRKEGLGSSALAPGRPGLEKFFEGGFWDALVLWW